MEIDLKDRKILYELDINSREHLSTIAKKVGLSKDSIIDRIDKMKKKGIINEFYTIIDFGKLGYIGFQVYLKLQSMKLEKEKELMDFLEQDKRVAFIDVFDGGYDIGFWVLVKDINEMHEFWALLSRKYVDYIRKRKFVMISKVKYFPKTYIIGGRNDQEYSFLSAPENKTNEKDIELLRLLIPNARISLLELSTKLGATPKTIAQRIKKLEEDGVIVAYKTRLSLEKLGYQYFKLSFMLRNLNNENYMQLKEYIKEHPNIIFHNYVIGGYDIEIEIQVKSLEELKGIMNDIKDKFADIIRDFNYMMFYKEQKFVFSI